MGFLSLLRRRRPGHGVAGIPTPGDRPRLELVVDDADGHGFPAHLTLVPAHSGILSVELLRDGRRIAHAMSRESLCIVGAFEPNTDVSVGSAVALDVIATASDGRLLAGPVALTPEEPWLTFDWKPVPKRS